MKALDKKSELKESPKKVTKPKTRNSQHLLNARPELGPAFVLTNPKIAQVKVKTDK